MKDGESVEDLREVRQVNPIVLNGDLCRIANASTIEARRHKDRQINNVRQRKVLEAKKPYALTEDLRLGPSRSRGAVARCRPKTLLKNGPNILVTMAYVGLLGRAELPNWTATARAFL